MLPLELKAELNKRPFLPFRIVTTLGKNYDVTERNRPMIRVGIGCVVIGFLLPETDPRFDRYEAVSLLHIVRREPILETGATG